MHDFIYFLKRWGITLVILGILYPMVFYYLEVDKFSSLTSEFPQLLLCMGISLGVSISGIMIMVVCESLKRKSNRALAIIILVGVYNVLNGMLLILAYPKNAMAYVILLVGIILFVQSFRIRNKMKTLT